MERLEMIEKLREYANVSYEEARPALDQANDDLLEAIVILEKQGKIKESKTKEQVQASGSSAESKTKRVGRTVADAIRSAWNFLCHTAFHVTRSGKEILVMPSLVFALLVLCFFYTIIPVMLIALFFNVRYSFTGTVDAEKANDVLNKAGSFAEGVKKAAETENV